MIIKRCILAILAVVASSATTAGPAEAVTYPAACSAWEQSGSIEFRACAVDTYSSTTMSNKVKVRNLSTTSKKVDLMVEGWVNGQLVRRCTWADVTLSGSATIERTCTVTRVDNYEYRSKAFYRSGSSTSQYLSQLSPALNG